MANNQPPHNYGEILADTLASFTDNGRSLRSFINHPHEMAICILTAGLMANSKLMMQPEDAIKASFDIHSRIQRHVAQYQSMQFAATVEDAFNHTQQQKRQIEQEQGETEWGD
jgi:hypothetical protein